MSGFNYGAFLLLGVDSLITCTVTAPMFIKHRSANRESDEYREVRSPEAERRASQRKWWAIAGISALAAPYAISYGIGDGLGFLLGTLFHFRPTNRSGPRRACRRWPAPDWAWSAWPPA